MQQIPYSDSFLNRQLHKKYGKNYGTSFGDPTPIPYIISGGVMLWDVLYLSVHYRHPSSMIHLLPVIEDPPDSAIHSGPSFHGTCT